MSMLSFPVWAFAFAAAIDIRDPILPDSYLKIFMGFCALVLSASVPAVESQPVTDATAESPLAASHGLIGELQNFLHRQGIDPDALSADAMVRLMVDWYRFTPVHTLGATVEDALVYRYGGWSEGCATAFKLSVLRRITQHDASGATAERFAGITLMFEPSAQAELVPFSAVSADAKSIDGFLQTIEGSPAFRELAAATPMGVLLESGAVR